MTTKKRKDSKGNIYMYDLKNRIVEKYNNKGILIEIKYSNGYTVKY